MARSLAPGSPRRRLPACRSTTGRCSRPPTRQVATVSSERLAELAGRQRGQGPQGPLLPRLLRHPGRRLRRRVPRRPRSPGSSGSPTTGRWRSSGSATSGQALANYRGFGARGFRVVALVDADPAKVGRRGRRARDRVARRPRPHRRRPRASRSASSPRRPRRRRRSPTGWWRRASRSILNFAPAVVTRARQRLAAQGRPRDRAADPVLLPAPRRRRRVPAPDRVAVTMPGDAVTGAPARRLPGEPAGRRPAVRRGRRRPDRGPQGRGAARRRRRRARGRARARRRGPGLGRRGPADRSTSAPFGPTDLDGAWLATDGHRRPGRQPGRLRGRRGPPDLGQLRRRPRQLLVHPHVGRPAGRSRGHDRDRRPQPGARDLAEGRTSRRAGARVRDPARPAHRGPGRDAGHRPFQ